MHDDGLAGDAVAGDGLYSLRLSLPASATPSAAQSFQYLVILGSGPQAPTIGQTTGDPMILSFPDGSARSVLISYSTAHDPTERLDEGCDNPLTVLACKGFQPQPSISDSWNQGPELRVVGELQSTLGGSAFDPGTGLGPFVADSPSKQSFEIISGLPLSGAFRLSSPQGGPSLGADGWTLTPLSGSGTGGDFQLSTQAWEIARFELLPARARARARASIKPALVPLISEIDFNPGSGFIELYNPMDTSLSLEGIVLSDDPSYPQAGKTPPLASPGDFLVGFPPGTVIAAHTFFTISLGDRSRFQSAHGIAPDFELPLLPELTAGSRDSAFSLDPSGEFLVLAQLQKNTPLVADLDLLVWGSPTAEDAPPDKSGIALDKNTVYGSDNMSALSLAAPTGFQIERFDFSEGGEQRSPDGNGPKLSRDSGLRDDESSEPLVDTFRVAAVPSPSRAPLGGRYLLSGRLHSTTEGRRPLAQVALSLLGASESTRSDTLGRFTLPSTEGSQSLLAHLFHYEDLVSAPFTIQRSNLFQDFGMKRLKGLRVAGQIFRRDGRPLPDALVTIVDSPVREWQQSTRSDLNGRFEFLDVSVGQPSISGSPAPKLYQLEGSKAGFVSTSMLTTLGDQDIGDLAIYLDPVVSAFLVEGEVIDAVTELPIAGVSLQIKALSASAVSDGGGVFTFRLVPRGSWSLEGGAPGYQTGSLPIEIVDGDLLGLRVPLTPAEAAFSFSGRVVSESLGLPIPGAQLSLRSDQGRLVEGASDRQGAFVLSGLSKGIYDFSVRAQGFQTFEEAKLSLPLTGARELRLQQASGQGFQLKGRVQLFNQPTEPCKACVIKIEGPSGNSTKSDAGGNFQFSKLPLGIYQVTASKADFQSASIKLPITSDLQQDFILQPDQDQGRGIGAKLGCSTGRAADPPGGALALLILFGLGVGLRGRRRS